MIAASPSTPVVAAADGRVVSGIGAKFPDKYQDAIYGLDWTFGTIYAIHAEPDGAGYKGSANLSFTAHRFR